MSKLREEKLPFEVLAVEDYSKGIEGFPNSDVLKFYVKNGWIAVCPSGTEPKIKFYLGVKEGSQEQADQVLEILKNDILNNNI